MRHFLSACLALIFLAGWAGCKRAQPPAPADQPAAETPAEPDQPAAPDKPSITQAEAEAVVATWLAAQNSGDFAAYQALYGAQMTGIRRSGKKTVRLDRDGWMKDRERMFKKPMTVAAERFSFVPRDTGLHVFFTQTWASGKYKDVGRKVLVLARAGDTVEIRSEEMLSSKILPPAERRDPAQIAGPAPEGGRATLPHGVGVGSSKGHKLALAFAGAGSVHLARIQSDIGVGPVTTEHVTIEAASAMAVAAEVWREVNDKALPPELVALRGLRVQLYDAHLSPLCTATIGKRFTLVAEDWIAKEVYEEDAAAALWAEGAYHVVAKLEGDAACVSKAAFVRDAALPAPILPPDLADDVEKKLEPDLPESDDDANGPAITTSMIALPGGRAAVAVRSHTPDTCETQEGHKLEVDIQIMDEHGEWSSDGAFSTTQEETLLFALDIDGDGLIEVVTSRGVYILGAAGKAGDDYYAWLPDLRVYWPPGLGCDGYDPSDDEPGDEADD